jgi:hypothetical protein
VVSLITIISRYEEVNLNKRFIFWNVTPGSPLKVKQETSKKQVASRAYSSTLKIEATCSSESRVTFNGLHGVIAKKKELFMTTEL